MNELLSKARFVFGEEWKWEAREYGTPQPKRISFAFRDGLFASRAVGEETSGADGPRLVWRAGALVRTE